MRIPVTLDGWFSGEIFLDWMKTIFTSEVRPLQTPHTCVVLLLDGSKTHVSLERVKELKAPGLELVLFPHPI